MATPSFQQIRRPYFCISGQCLDTQLSPDDVIDIVNGRIKSIATARFIGAGKPGKRLHLGGSVYVDIIEPARRAGEARNYWGLDQLQTHVVIHARLTPDGSNREILIGEGVLEYLMKHHVAHGIQGTAYGLDSYRFHAVNRLKS